MGLKWEGYLGSEIDVYIDVILHSIACLITLILFL